MSRKIFVKVFLPMILFVYAVIGWRASQITFENAGNARSQIRGDSLSESLTWNGARYFFDHGFWATKFMPNYGYTNEVAANKTKEFRKEWVYTHFPSLPDVLTGLTAVLMGTTDVRYLRIFPILLSPLLLWLMWRAISLMLDKKEAYVSFAALLLSNYFVAWADNIHKFLYEDLVKWTILFIFLRRFRVGPRREDIPLLALLYFLGACISFDAIIVSAVICVGFSLLYKKKLFTVETVVPGLVTVVALALHLVQNILFFESFDGAWHDLVTIFNQRTTGTGASEIGKLTLLVWLQHFFFWNINRVERYFLLPGWAVLFFAVYFYRRWQSAENPSFRLIPILLIAAVAWNCVMWQHAVVHVSTARNWGLIVGLLAGPALLYMWHSLSHFRQKNLLQQVGLAVLAFYIGGMALTQHFGDIYFQHGFLHTFLSRN